MQIKNKKGVVLHEVPGDSLEGADLIAGCLSGADLRGANLRGANLCGANLCRADLTGANLEDADLSLAYLVGPTYPARVSLHLSHPRKVSSLATRRYSRTARTP